MGLLDIVEKLPEKDDRKDVKKQLRAAIKAVYKAARDGSEEEFSDALEGAIGLGNLVDKEE